MQAKLKLDRLSFDGMVRAAAPLLNFMADAGLEAMDSHNAAFETANWEQVLESRGAVKVQAAYVTMFSELLLAANHETLYSELERFGILVEDEDHGETEA